MKDVITKKMILTAILLAIVTMAFTACDNDDNENNDKPKLKDGWPVELVGIWNCVRIVIDEDGDVETQTPKEGSHYMILEANGSATIKPATLFEDEKRGNITWRVKDGKLHFSDDSDYTVKKVDSKTLVLEWIDKDDKGYLKETHTFEKKQ